MADSQPKQIRKSDIDPSILTDCNEIRVYEFQFSTIQYLNGRPEPGAYEEEEPRAFSRVAVEGGWNAASDAAKEFLFCLNESEEMKADLYSGDSDINRYVQYRLIGVREVEKLTFFSTEDLKSIRAEWAERKRRKEAAAASVAQAKTLGQLAGTVPVVTKATSFTRTPSGERVITTKVFDPAGVALDPNP